MANDQALTKFVVWAPDHTDDPQRRLSLLKGHRERIHKLIDQGIIRGAGGGVLTSDSANAAPADRAFFGSCLIIEAESLDAVRKHIENDVFYKENVWDKEKLQILPIQLAVPLPPVSS